MIKNAFISVAMIITLGLITWMTFFSFRPQPVSSTRTALKPDAIMEDVTALIIDKQGKPSMKIVSPKVVHYSNNDTTQLTAPQMTLYRKSPLPWFISANSASATGGVENILFRNDVVIHHPADQTNPATFIKTSSLLVHPNAQTAETSEDITMMQPNLVVKATGLFADMNTGDIKLLSKARGEYVPDAS